jgi:hypothetical protein
MQQPYSNRTATAGEVVASQVGLRIAVEVADLECHLAVDNRKAIDPPNLPDIRSELTILVGYQSPRGLEFSCPARCRAGAAAKSSNGSKWPARLR